MSIVHNYGKDEFKINENDSIIIETKSEEGYEWKEVTFKTRNEDKEIYIGLYYTYNYSSSREWMEYNENYIVLLEVHSYGHEFSNTQVKKIFDINSKQVLEESQEALLKIYNREFKQISKKKVLTQK